MSQSVQAMKITKGPDKFTLMVALFSDQDPVEDPYEKSVSFTVEYNGSNHRLTLRVDKVERVRSETSVYRIQGYGVLETLGSDRVSVFEHLPVTVTFSTKNPYWHSHREFLITSRPRLLYERRGPSNL